MEARYSAENQEEVTRNWGNIDLLKGLHQLRLTLLVVLFPEKGGGLPQVGEGLGSIYRRKRKEEIKEWVSHLQALQAQMIPDRGKYSVILQHRILHKEPAVTRDFPLGFWVKWRGGKPQKLSLQQKGP